MPSAIDWYLVELRRRLSGRLPSQEVDQILDETEDHLSEIGEIGAENIVKRFGSPYSYSLSLISKWHEPSGGFFRNSALALPSLFVVMPGLLLGMYYATLSGRSNIGSWLILLLATLAFVGGFTARKSLLVPIAVLFAPLVLIAAIQSGFAVTSAIEPKSYPQGVALRFLDGGPKSHARVQLATLSRERSELERLTKLASEGKLSKGDLQVPSGFKTSLYVLTFESERVGVSYTTEFDFAKALKTWQRSPTAIKQRLNEQIADYEEWASARWSTVLEEAWYQSLNALAFTAVTCVLALAGNACGFLFRSRIWWQRRRYA